MADESYKELHLGPMPTETVEIFDRVVQARRSCRQFSDEPIPPHVVNQVLDWALLAPNSSNLQPWEFHVVRNPALRQKLTTASFDQPAAATAQVMVVCVARRTTWRRNRKEMLRRFRAAKTPVPKKAMQYYEVITPLAYTQGPFGILRPFKWLLFSILGLFRPIPRFPVGQAQQRMWAEKTTALACEHIMLGFKAHGFDSCPMEGFDAVRVKQILKLPADASVTMIISAGRGTAEGIYGPRMRFERENFVIQHD